MNIKLENIKKLNVKKPLKLDCGKTISNFPLASNRYATLPDVPRFPPYFVNACLISETVLFLLSVKVLINTATPPGAYPS